MRKYDAYNIEAIINPPPQEELVRRVEKIREGMMAHDLDCYICIDPDNIFYLTNFANFVHERPFILIIPYTGRISFLVPKLEVAHVMARKVGDINIVEYFEFPGKEGKKWNDKLLSIIEGNRRIGIESVCPAFLSQNLKSDHMTIDLVEDIRMTKSEYEIGRIVYASQMVSDAIDQILKMAKPGLSMLTVHSTINKRMMLKLLLDIPEINFLATRLSVAVQPPGISHDPHNFTNVMDMDMERGGPHVAIMNCVINGYSSEVERTFFIGDVPKEARKPYEVMMRARQMAFELCVAGNNMSEVDRSVNQVFVEAGYGEHLLHRTGHSIGVTGHEGPFLAEGYDMVIQPNMFFTIEPGIYLPGIGGFRHSDTILTTENGNVSLTPVSDSLVDMTLNTNRFSFSSFFSKHRISIMKLYARWKGIELFE